MDELKKKLLLGIFLSLNLITFIVLIYAPGLIYYAQVNEFHESFASLVFKHAIVGLVTSILITILLSFLSVKLLKFALSLFFLMAILAYLQVDFFAISYGILDGSEIDFSLFNSRGNAEILVLITTLLLVIFLRNWIAKNGVLVLVIVFVGLSGSLAFKATSTQGHHENNESTDPEFNYYSSEKNVIIIVLDGFGSEYFQTILNENPEIKNNYDGFVSYTDAISNYSATVGSIPSMLLGQMYPRNQRFKSFIDTAVASNGLPKIFDQMGYVVSFISWSSNFKNIYPMRFMSDISKDREAYKRFNALKLLDFSLFRLSPHYLKPTIFSGGNWFLSKLAADNSQIPNTYSERGKYYLDYVTENAVLDDEKPRFKLIHATIPHPEYKFNAQCEKHEYKKSDEMSFRMVQQSKCALVLLNKLLDKYKSMGIYDNSLIVVTSDHGARVYDNPELTGFPSDFELSASGILFMIKGVGQTDKFKQVTQPFSLLKVKDALDDEGKHGSDYSYLEDDNRLFYAYQPVQKSAKGYLNDAPLYEVAKDYRNPNSWKLLEFVTNNCEKQKLPIKMKFSKSNRTGYCGAFGFKQYGRSFKGIWTIGEDSRVIFGLDKQSVKKPSEVAMALLVKPKLQGQQESIDLSVHVNGHLVNKKQLIEPKTQNIKFDIPVSVLKDGDNEIQFVLSEIKSGKQLGVNNNDDKLGVFIEELQLIK